MLFFRNAAMDLRKVNFTTLEGIVTTLEGTVKLNRALRVGATVDIPRRAREYTGDYQFSGRPMYYAETSNMKYAENRLLMRCEEGDGCRANIQRRSNVRDEPGYVYAIV